MNDGGAVLVKGIAGLGNRILNALNGICYAQLTGRKLFIDWSDSDYSGDGSNIFESLFRCPTLASGSFPRTDSVHPAIWRGRLDVEARTIGDGLALSAEGIRKQLSSDLSRIDYPEELVVLVEYDVHIAAIRRRVKGESSAHAKRPHLDIVRDMLRRDLILHPHLQERVAQFKRRHLNGPTVGVHIRYSDYRGALFTIIRRLNRLMRERPELTIFLCSDSADAIAMLRRVYPRIVTTEHWFAKPGSSLHRNHACPDKLQSAMDALTDMYLLAQCEYLIFDWTSSFSRLAYLLSDQSTDNLFPVRYKEGKSLSFTQRRMTRIMRKTKFFSWGFRVMPRIVPLRWL